MNIEASLRLKIRTIKRMEIEFANNELVDTEIDDLQILTDELRDLAEEYVKGLGAEELVKRVGWDHWLITNEGIESETVEVVLGGLEDLLGEI